MAAVITTRPTWRGWNRTKRIRMRTTTSPTTPSHRTTEPDAQTNGGRMNLTGASARMTNLTQTGSR
jgi:hypothetical protein